jgi:hypothetical protein
MTQFLKLNSDIFDLLIKSLFVFLILFIIITNSKIGLEISVAQYLENLYL